jgi:hypothetical protein
LVSLGPGTTAEQHHHNTAREFVTAVLAPRIKIESLKATRPTIQSRQSEDQHLYPSLISSEKVFSAVYLCPRTRQVLPIAAKKEKLLVHILQKTQRVEIHRLGAL